MNPKLYLETTIPSYLTSRPSRDLIVAGHQQITREWWETKRGDFDISISQFVLDEAGDGDPDAARERINVIASMPILHFSPDAESLAGEFLKRGLLPFQATVDAADLAIATTYGMDFLLTWNCAHLANPSIVKTIAAFCSMRGLECPIVCIPEALMGE